MSKNRYGGVEPYAAFFVAHKVKQLIRMPLFYHEDYEDLEQELMMAYLKAKDHFDPSKGHIKAFIKSVINNHARNLIIIAEAQKNWTGQKELSLNEKLFEDNQTYELIDNITQEQMPWCSGYGGFSIESLELLLDEERIVQNMPEALRETYEILKDYSVSEAAKLMGLNRTTLSSRAQKLKKYLQDLKDRHKS